MATMQNQLHEVHLDFVESLLGVQLVANELEHFGLLQLMVPRLFGLNTTDCCELPP